MQVFGRIFHNQIGEESLVGALWHISAALSIQSCVMNGTHNNAYCAQVTAFQGHYRKWGKNEKMKRKKKKRKVDVLVPDV